MVTYSIILFCTSLFHAVFILTVGQVFLKYGSYLFLFELPVSSWILFHLWKIYRFLLFLLRDRKWVHLLFQNCIIYMNSAFHIRFEMWMPISSQSWLFKPLCLTLFLDLDQIHPLLIETSRIISADLLSCNSLLPKGGRKDTNNCRPTAALY